MEVSLNIFRKAGLVAFAAACVVSTLATAIPANAASTSAPRAASGCVTNIYRQGSSGTCVKYIQQLAYVSADGVFGPNTRNAVVRFQRNQGITADGIVGRTTWLHLCVPGDGPYWSPAARAAGCPSMYL
jgi:peptidoglycan hydrolase-like protein with peptidoglycan-binding domain